MLWLTSWPTMHRATVTLLCGLDEGDIFLVFDEWRICLADRQLTPSDRHTHASFSIHTDAVLPLILPPVADRRWNKLSSLSAPVTFTLTARQGMGTSFPLWEGTVNGATDASYHAWSCLSYSQLLKMWKNSWICPLIWIWTETMGSVLGRDTSSIQIVCVCVWVCVNKGSEGTV